VLLPTDGVRTEREGESVERPSLHLWSNTENSFFPFLHSIESVCYLKRCATKFGCFSRPNKHEFLEGFISRRVDVDEAIP
jgi:hypothetical protein